MLVIGTQTEMFYVRIISNDANRQTFRFMLQNNFTHYKYIFKLETSAYSSDSGNCAAHSVPESKEAPHAANTGTGGGHTVLTRQASIVTILKMNKKLISSRLRVILHSLATRVPKIVLCRAEHVFPALNTSMVSFLSSR